ncbi:iron-sulfur cluster assembly scaffold protein [Candidatus Dojkabacteria bacterium]|uniref:Iron-sulfur cluster assembly scaffold protein n=1 Tax=Candidatus Dojkabacteria bacterium TaxID=2099670 RepID=A0A955RLX0_9BACT|nr:iron-sulfur cluster assembly scaffold protein [Candidatus Dojkabacteria bacterium]
MNDRQLEILDHYKHPRNFEKTNFKFTNRAKESNLTCGDEIEMEVIVREGRVEDINFTGEGCSLCIAGASMLTETVVGKTVEEIEGFNNDDMIGVVGLEVTPAREKCIVLGLDTLKSALLLKSSR